MNNLEQSSGFMTTRWSLVLQASKDPAALNTLLSDYWGPMYAFVRRSGHTIHDAADLVQEFVSQRLIAGALLDRADPHRGRFRTFLKSSLRNFLTDQHRRGTALKRAPSRADAHRPDLAELEPFEQDDPSQAFDRQWVTTLLSRTIARVQAECDREQQQRHWAAFERTVLIPSAGGADAPTLADLADELGVESPHVVSSMVQTVHRKFRRLLRIVIEETVADPREVDDEFLELRAFLGLVHR